MAKKPTAQELAKIFNVSPEKASAAARGFEAPELTLPSEAETAENAMTLPAESAPSSNLLTFKQTMDQVVRLGKQKRNDATAGLMAPFRGTVAASDFSSIIGNLNAASDASTEDVLKDIMPEKIETDIVDLGGKKVLINTQTGDVIKELGKTADGGVKLSTTVVDLNGRKVLINDQTGAVIADFSLSVPTAPMTPEQQQRATELSTLVNELLSDTAVGKGSAVGASLAKFVPGGQALGLQGKRAAFENKVASLKANLTLDNLSLLKGPMSDKDLAFLQAVGSALSTDMTEEAFNAELNKVLSKLGAPIGATKTKTDEQGNVHTYVKVGPNQWQLQK